jgi:multisubunit Na+/H+ antiporter MnhB subunit
MLLSYIYNLCTPAKLYFIISLVLFILSFYYDVTRNDKDKICLGKVNCKVQNKPAMFIMNIVFIILWTILLNILCMYGWSKLSWFLFLFPYTLILILLLSITGLVLYISSNKK